MTRDDIRDGFVRELVRVAPDIDPATLGDGDHLQDDLGLDSMDILNLVAALHARFGVNIPETDYPAIATPMSATEYLARALAG